jgi:hypothetical protein
MRRSLSVAALAALVVVLAGCGGSKKAATVGTTTNATARPSPAAILGPGGRALYVGGDWAVVQRGAKAAAVRWVGRKWRVDDRGLVKIDVLGPRGAAPGTPQVAAQMTGRTRLVEEGLWVDGTELLEKGGGLKPTQVTVYGAPEHPLRAGKHVAVAYGRTATAGTAVAWTFTVS